MFFKSSKEIKTEDLKLTDFDKIWTKFCFLDETGTLSDQKDQYFNFVQNNKAIEKGLSS